MLVASCREGPVAGKQIHDANIAATMLAHAERRALTFNARDFRPYGERIALANLKEAAAQLIAAFRFSIMPSQTVTNSISPSQNLWSRRRSKCARSVPCCSTQV